MIYFITDQEVDLASTKVFNNIRKLENVINILSEPQGIPLFLLQTYLPEKYKCATTVLDKRVKYVGNILKYVFTFIVTVMTFAAAIIPMMTFYTSTPTPTIGNTLTTIKNWESTTLNPNSGEGKNWYNLIYTYDLI